MYSSSLIFCTAQCLNAAIGFCVIVTNCCVSVDTTTSRVDEEAYLDSGRRPLVDVATTPRETTETIDGGLATDSEITMNKQLNCESCVLRVCMFHSRHIRGIHYPRVVKFYQRELSKDFQCSRVVMFLLRESSKDLQNMCRSVRVLLDDMLIGCTGVFHLCALIAMAA